MKNNLHSHPYDRFFKEFIALEPQRREARVTPEVWRMLAEIESTPSFSLRLIGLVNTCPALVTHVIAKPDWLSKLTRPWHWGEIFFALREVGFPLTPCKQFADFLLTKGDEGQLLLDRLSDKISLFELKP